MFALLAIIGSMWLPAADRCSAPDGFEAFRAALPADPMIRAEALEKHLAGNPDDVWAHRLYLEASLYHRKPARERYVRLAEEHPDDIDFAYLRARTLIGSDTEKALRLFDEIETKDQTYPWIYPARMEVYRSTLMRDPAKLRAAFDRFTGLCPQRLEAYTALPPVLDAALAARVAERLRPLLEATGNPDDWKLYAVLWKAAPEDKARIAADVRRLQSHPQAERSSIRQTIYVGARFLDDRSLQEQSRFVDRSVAYAQWAESNPSPPSGEALLAQSARWREHYPGYLLGYIEQLNALVQIEASTPEEIEDAVEQVQAFDKRFPYAGAEYPTPHRVAEALVRRGIFLERVPALIENAIARLRDPENLIEVDIQPMPYRASRRFEINVNSLISAWRTEARAYLKLNDVDSARAVAQRMQDHLAGNAPPKNEIEPKVPELYGGAEGDYFETKAEIALAEGHKADALLYYRQAQATSGFPHGLVGPQAKLWRELGGTAEGWHAWQDSIEPKPWSEPALSRPPWTKSHRELPAFTLRDAEGNEWTLDRLRGKTTLVNVWASWCGPCREELPYVQELADRIRDRPDTQVITLNVDENPQHAERYRKSTGLRVPVIAANAYVDRLNDEFSLPWTWIVGPDGVIVREQAGFDKEGWVEEALRQLP